MVHKARRRPAEGPYIGGQESGLADFLCGGNNTGEVHVALMDSKGVTGQVEGLGLHCADGGKPCYG